MPLLIDGYNLLHAAGVPGRGRGIGPLERSRLGLLHFLLRTLEPDEVAETTVVFDALNAPSGVPEASTYRGLSIRFARPDRYDSADALLEELIATAPNPRRLTVVSSDHRIHRAARRRGARCVDSDAWCVERARRRERARTAPPILDDPALEKPSLPRPESEIAAWLAAFGEPVAPRTAPDAKKSTADSQGPPADTRRTPAPDASPEPPGPTRPETASASNAAATPTAGGQPTADVLRPKPAAGEEKRLGPFDNPFPPDYLEALEREFPPE